MPFKYFVHDPFYMSIVSTSEIHSQPVSLMLDRSTMYYGDGHMPGHGVFPRYYQEKVWTACLATDGSLEREPISFDVLRWTHVL